MSTTTIYPLAGKPRPVVINASGPLPAPQEVPSLTAVPFPSAPPSGPEAKNAFKWFLIGIGVGVAAWFFGGWVIKGFQGLGVLFFGYGAKYLLAPGMLLYALISIGRLLRSPRKKNPDDAMKWVWVTSLLGDDAVSERFGSPEYALSTLLRIIPPDRRAPENQLSDYIDYVRKVITDAAEATAAAEKEGGWSTASPQISFTVTDRQELGDGAELLSAVLCFQDCLSKSDGNSNTTTKICAIVELHISQVFLRSGKYWYPFEVRLPLSAGRAPSA